VVKAKGASVNSGRAGSRKARWLIAAWILACLGCGRDARAPVLASLPSGAAGGRSPATHGTISLSEFCRTYGLQMRSDPGCARVVLASPGREIVIAAGLSAACMNGRVRSLPRPPRVIRGELFLPEAITALLGAAPRAGRVRGTVVLDPGHGGRDAGAVANGLQEKDVVLDVARRVAERLRAAGVEVILTRQSDVFISLGERSRIANRTAGAVFVSIHANALGARDANRLSAHGVETFVLAQRVSEASRVAKAASEYDLEKSTAQGAESLSPEAERAAIAALSKEARSESVDLARRVQGALVRETRDTDRQVRQMNLAVLRETYFGPAILTEIGFLTHPATARALATVAYRARVAQGIADGIIAHLGQ